MSRLARARSRGRADARQRPPRQGKQVADRKTDVSDAAWRCQLAVSTASSTQTSGGDYYYARRDPQHQTRRLLAQLERLGHTVTLQKGPEEGSSVIFPLKSYLQGSGSNCQMLWMSG